MLKSTFRGLALGAAASLSLSAGPAFGWSLEEAAKPYAGTTVDVVFLLRPG